MRGGASKWCFLRHNETLRTAIKFRLKNYNVTQLCADLKIHRNNLYHYLDGTEPKAITCWKLQRLCNKIGVVLALKVEYAS